MKRKHELRMTGSFVAKPLELGKPLQIGRPISLGKPLRLHRKVSWMQPEKTKKQMTYPEARSRYDLSPRGDADKDGKLNYMDCRPYDFSKQGIFGDIATGIKKRIVGEEPRQSSLDEYGEGETKTPSKLRAGARKVVAGAKEKIGDIEERHTQVKQYKKALKTGVEETAGLPWFIVVKIRNDKWYQWGPYDDKVSANSALESKKGELGHATIEKSLLTQNPTEARGRNIEGKLEHVAGRVEAYKAETGMDIRSTKKRVKEGLQIDPDALGKMAERVTNVHGVGPPASKQWYRPGAGPLQRKEDTEKRAARTFRRALFGKSFGDRDSKAGISFKTPERERLPEEQRRLRPVKDEAVSEYSEDYQPVEEERGFDEVIRTSWTPRGKVERIERKYKPFKPKIARLGPRKKRPEN